MTYARFKQLWNALVRDRPRSMHDKDIIPHTPCSKATSDALIEYGQHGTGPFKDIRERMAIAKREAAVARREVHVVDVGDKTPNEQLKILHEWRMKLSQ